MTFSQFAAGLGMALLIIFILAIVMIILAIVGLWKVFEKCGVEGWKAIIPIYSYIVLMQIVKLNPLWIIPCFIPGIGSIFFLIVSIAVSIRLASGFGKTTGFAVGLVLLNLVFNLILGFDDSTWNPKKMDLASFSFMNDADATNNTGKSSGHAESAKGTPEDPWVEGK